MNRLFDIIFYSLGGVSPAYGIAAVSLLASVVILYLFKLTADQAGIRQAKDRAKAYLLELRIYRDDVGLSLAAIKSILIANILYIKAAAKPMLAIALPILFIIVQLGSRYEHRPLRPGEPAIVSVKLDEGLAGAERFFGRDEIKLIAPDGITIETPAMRIPARREIDWRIRADRAGAFELRIAIDGQGLTKQVVAGEGLARISTRRVSSGLEAALLGAGEPAIPDSSPVESIEVKYPPRTLSIFGLEMHWLLAFFLFCLLFAYGMRGLFKVEI